MKKMYKKPETESVELISDNVLWASSPEPGGGSSGAPGFHPGGPLRSGAARTGLPEM